jgi:hypothetical protein
MSEFSLFIRNQAKEAERKLKVQFSLCAAAVFCLCAGGCSFAVTIRPAQPYVWLHVKGVVLVYT